MANLMANSGACDSPLDGYEGLGGWRGAEAPSAKMLTKQHSGEDRVPIKINLPFWCHHTDLSAVTVEVLCDHRTHRPLCILKRLLIQLKVRLAINTHAAGSMIVPSMHD